MGITFSIYLELIRLSAALMVLFGHLIGINPAYYNVFESLHIDHDGVIFFFVLSGYVISYVTSVKEKDLYTYSVNRMARIYSVAIPALLLAIVAEWGLWHFNKTVLWPTDFTQVHGSVFLEMFKMVKTFLIAVTFTNEIHWHHMWIFWDLPYWSLAYEVWYYVLFAAFFFASGWKRWLWMSVIAAIIGIKILLLFPVWLVGVAIQKCHQRFTINERTAWMIWIATIFTYIVLKFFDPYIISYHLVGQPLERLLGRGLDGSNGFGWDYVLAIITGANIFAFRYLSVKWLAGPRVSNAIRQGASYTYSLYLYQILFIIIWKPFTYDKYPHILGVVVLCVAVLISVVILGRYTEHKKQLARTWIKFILSKLNTIISRKSTIQYQEAS